uniref:Terpene synthase metal-binding domain-containing protein n=1 Tax=Musa acuminata subsp. malaccensis TaxID=214687 RepID=A0A804HZA8_MUSAM
MDESLSYLVERIKDEMFSPSADMLSFLPLSPYDTAWVAMVAGPQSPHSPMFPKCLEWILRHQRDEGYWGELGTPMDSLTSTLACVVALNAWDTGHANIEKGLGFLRANMVKLLMEHRGGIPRWFSIVFPGMLELALAKGLPVLPDGGSMPAVNNVFNRRETILAMEKSSGNDRHPPLTSFLETLPISCRPNHEVILGLQMEDGSLFHSPSATACAFMITGDRNCLEYLQTMMKRCSNVVPSVFPVDEDLIKLCLVDHLRRLWCGEHFAEEIRGVMDHTYRLSCSPFVVKLAIESFLNRQFLYKNELEELKRSSEESGLSKMGIGQERTTYCFAECGVIVTIADDLFDEKGSLNEVERLTESIHRWNGENL